MKILITGSGGFIGRNLKEYLGKFYELCVPNHAELDLLDNTATENYLKQHNFDVVVHCATHNATANSAKDLNLVLKNNLMMSFNLIRCHKLYGRMFYFGSGAEYDRANYIPKMPEDYFDTHVPQDDYGFSKYITAKAVQSIDNIFNLRIFGCFGPYEDWEVRFISNAICKTLFNLDITIRRNVFFDYLYIKDLCRIIEWFISQDSLKHNTYNICTGKSIDLKSLAEIILKISGKTLQIKIAQTGLNPEYSGNNSRLIAEMNDFIFTPIDNAIKELYEYYLENKDTLIKQDLLLNDKSK